MLHDRIKAAFVAPWQLPEAMRQRIVAAQSLAEPTRFLAVDHQIARSPTAQSMRCQQSS